MSLPPGLTNAVVPPEILDVLERLKAAGYSAFLVGGCVRDLVLGKVPTDFDVATSALPGQVQRVFKKVIPTGLQHGTVTVLARGRHVEVTTFRTESGYVDGRRPERVEFKASIEEDLSRRDFTINAMAYEPQAEDLRDPFGGLADLAARRVRCVGDPLERFGEDGLRPLRAVRFAAVLGFSIDPATLQAIPRTVEVFRKVSAERVREELVKLLLCPRTREGLTLLEQGGLLSVVYPELSPGAGAAEAVLARALELVPAVPADLETRLAALLLPAAEATCGAEDREGVARIVRTLLGRLKFPNKNVDRTTKIAQKARLDFASSWSDSQVRRFVSDVGGENVDPVLDLAAADHRGHPGELQVLQAVRSRAAEVLSSGVPLSTRDLALDGQAIMRVLNVGPSPLVGQATRFLLEQVLEDPLLNRSDRLAELLRAWVAKSRPT